MKTAELAGIQLDYWVAKAEGMEARISGNTLRVGPAGTLDLAQVDFHPSSDASYGRPIIEKMTACELFSIERDYERRTDWYCATIIKGERTVYPGETELIAAMRAKVASVYGDEVPDA